MINVEIALFQPDMAPNVGSLIRLSACLGAPLNIIEPCGFPLDDKRLRRAAMDYYDAAQLRRHASWEQFLEAMAGRRLVLLTTKSALPYVDFAFQSGDVLVLGRESAGAPDFVHARADAAVCVPMRPGARSLNLVQAACMVTGEAFRQTQLFHAA